MLTPRTINNCNTAEQLVQLIVQHLYNMHAMSLAAVLMRLPKLRCREPQPYADCLQRYLVCAPDDTARGLSNVMYALCKAPAAIQQQHQAALQQQLLPAFVQKLSAANPQDISNVLYGLAVSGQQLETRHLQQLLDAFASILPQAKPQDVSNVLWAVATMEQQVPSGQLQQLLAALGWHAAAGQATGGV
jgi:hypothetical protein